jgi:subtilase family serine protease
MVRLPGHVPAAVAEATPVPAPPDAEREPVTLTVVLKLADADGFRRRLGELYDRRSPRFHAFEEPRAIADRFGPTADAYAAVLAYLEQHGLTLVSRSRS